jgi:hypothetical protein
LVAGFWMRRRIFVRWSRRGCTRPGARSSAPTGPGARSSAPTGGWRGSEPASVLGLGSGAGVGACALADCCRISRVREHFRVMPRVRFNSEIALASVAVGRRVCDCARHFQAASGGRMEAGGTGEGVAGGCRIPRRWVIIRGHGRRILWRGRGRLEAGPTAGVGERRAGARNAPLKSGRGAGAHKTASGGQLPTMRWQRASWWSLSMVSTTPATR